MDVFEQGCREGSFLGNYDVEAMIAFFSDLPTPVKKRIFPLKIYKERPEVPDVILKMVVITKYFLLGLCDFRALIRAQRLGKAVLLMHSTMHTMMTST